MSTWSRALQPFAASLDEVDWEAVYADQLPRVYNFFRYRVGDGPLAEDLTATTFEKAWRARGRYRHDLGAFSTWLYTIAQRVASDYFRAARDDASLDSVAEWASSGSVEDTVQQRSDFAQLSALLGALSARDRELVALKYGAALNNREIAHLTGLSESNVGTLVHRITQRLRQQWDT